MAEITTFPHTLFLFPLGIQLDCVFWALVKEAGAHGWVLAREPWVEVTYAPSMRGPQHCLLNLHSPFPCPW